jgi:hypothetical protein
MKVLSNTLELTWNQWDDPGDYPNSLAASPQPSYFYPVLKGEIVLKAETFEDSEKFQLETSDWICEFVDFECKKYTIKWELKTSLDTCVICAKECEMS